MKSMQLYRSEKWISLCEVLSRDYAPKASCTVKRSTRSVLATFNTLRAFTNEPIGEEKIGMYECLIKYTKVAKVN